MRKQSILALLTSLLLAGCENLKLTGPQATGTTQARGSASEPGAFQAGGGQVLDASGNAVAGARIRVFESASLPEGVPAGLLDGRANPLVSNQSGNLVSNQTGAFTVRAIARPVMTTRSIQALQEVTTDGGGRFSLAVPAGVYNLEAAAPDGKTKAWQANLSVTPDGRFETSPLKLMPTGRISGQVAAEDPGVRDLLRTQVFIPGSSYAASTTTDGWFVISDVPPGTFPIFAWHPTLGEAMLEASKSIHVESSRTTATPKLVLRRPVPEVESILAAGTSRPVAAAAPGTSLDLVGQRFGATSGRTFKVAVQGVPILDARRLSDELIRFTLPAGVRNGNVTLEVDNVFAPAQPLRVVKSVVWKKTNVEMTAGATADLHVLLDVRDTDDIAVVPVHDGGRIVRRPAELTFAVDGPRLYVGEEGTLRALSEGHATVTVTAGTLPPRTLEVSVLPDGHASITPSPAPGIPGDPTGPDPGEPIPYKPEIHYDDPGELASWDGQDVFTHHLFGFTRNGVKSSFVWVPRFRAYQLIHPENCDTLHVGTPVGTWVARQPSRGLKGKDWIAETFGGFYAGQFEACREDAIPGELEPANGGAGATAGAAGMFKVAEGCVPWTGVTWQEAVNVCAAYDPYCHLMEDEEWTALAVWSMITGVTVRGNNHYGADIEASELTFYGDPTLVGGRSLTGTGQDRSRGFLDESNPTSHTGRVIGVFDLHGNVAEWTATVGGVAGSTWYHLDGNAVPVSMPRGGEIQSLSTDPLIRRLGLPGTTAIGNGFSPTGGFGGDLFPASTAQLAQGLTHALRGGNWNGLSHAGIWNLDLQWPGQHLEGEVVGFRPVLRYDR